MSFAQPPIWMMVLWALWLLQAGGALNNVARFRRRLRLHLAREARRKLEVPSVGALLIVPMKGIDPQMAEHVGSLLNQDYTCYRVVFVVQSEADAAYGAITRMIGGVKRAAGCKGAEIIVAGLAESGGQKVHNLLAALGGMTERDELLVFADADAVPETGWLKSVAWVLCYTECGAVTGYRWFVPESGGLACHLASAINSSVATMLGPPWRNHAWGGSMAISRKMAQECDLVGHWRGALSDDYQLSLAVRSSGKQIYFAPQALTASEANFTWASLLEFGRRQYLITRVHVPFFWLLSLAVLAIYITGWATAIAGAVMGNGWAVVAMAIVMTLDILRGRLRADVPRLLWGQPVAAKLRVAALLDTFATPLVMGLHLGIAISSVLGRRIRWAGITYEMRGRQDVRILGRDEPPNPG